MEEEKFTIITEISAEEDTSPEEDASAEEDAAVDADALIENDEKETDPEAGTEEASEEEEAENLEKQDAEENLPGIDDTEEDGVILQEDQESGPVVDPKDLVDVVGVRFRTAGKAYYFAVGKLPVKRGSHVIVETARGLEYGTSVCDPMQIDRKRFKAPVKRIIRIATPTDDRRVQENREKEREAYRVCFEKIRLHNMDMKLIDAEYTFDNSKILFYFTSDGRVDFRDLVKDLAGVFHTRIELRQVGVRDETKILGGYGICGRPLCCHTYLSDFVPVSIKMAKEQNLSLNPTKISGVCGRLMCCLKNEEETYEDLNRNLPRLGDEVQGGDGLTGDVVSVNILKQTVRILVEVDDEKELHEYPADQITILRRRKRGQAKPRINRAELRGSGNRPGYRRDHTQKTGAGDARVAAEEAASGSREAGGDGVSAGQPGGEMTGRPERSDRPAGTDGSRSGGRPPRSGRQDRPADRQNRPGSGNSADGNEEHGGKRPYRKRTRRRGSNERRREKENRPAETE